MELSLRRSAIEDLHVLVVSGDIDLTAIPRFSDAVSRLVIDSGSHIGVVDLDGTDTMDDTALGVLLGAAGRARKSNGDLVVVATTDRIVERLERTGFSRAIRVIASVAHA